MRGLSWMLVATSLLPGPAALARSDQGWMVGDLIGAAVIVGDGRVAGRLADLYAGPDGRVCCARVILEGAVGLVDWPFLHPDRAGHVVRLGGGVQRDGLPPPGLASLGRAAGALLRLPGGTAYGRVGSIRIGGNGRIETVFVTLAAPSARPYSLAWTALDYASLPRATPQLATTPR